MATLGYGSGITGSNISTVGEIQTLGFSLSADSADTTSTVSQYASGVPTVIKSNSIFITLAYDGSSNGETQNFVKEFKLKRIGTWVINFSDGGIFRSKGYVSRVTVAAPNSSASGMDITINLTGEPSFNGN